MKRTIQYGIAAAGCAVALLATTEAHAVAITTSYVDALTLGVTHRQLAATTKQAATVAAALYCTGKAEECYTVHTVLPYTFTYAMTVDLPKVGETYDGGYIDQTFHDSTKTHEDWHVAYTTALLASTYGALEKWSASYDTGRFPSAAAAIAVGETDMANALALASATFLANLGKDVTDLVFGDVAKDAYAYKTDIDGVMTWRSHNPDWGADAVAFANSVKVAFVTTTGSCHCPEPASLALLGMGLLGMYIARRRQRTCRTA